MDYKQLLRKFLNWSSKAAGKPITFIIALLFLSFWILGGFIWGFTDTWLLIIDSIATINASLMVFIIHHTQIRDTKALHAKLDGIIFALQEAERKLIAIEEVEEEELENIYQELRKKHRK